MAETYEFSCPKCSQPLQGTYEHIGLETQCPGCGEAFVIPNFLSTSTIGRGAIQELTDQVSEEEVTEVNRANMLVFETFNDSQLHVLQQQEGEILQKARRLKCRNCWEFAITAALLDRRIADLRQTVYNTEYEQECQSGWNIGHGRHHKFIKNHCCEYFDIIVGLEGIMGEELHTALTSQDLTLIFQLANNLQDLILRLTEFHEAVFSEPVPQSEVYIEINEILVGWVPQICVSLDKLIEFLQKNCSKMRDSWTITPQISFIGTSLPQLFNVAASLKIGFTKPESVQASI